MAAIGYSGRTAEVRRYLVEYELIHFTKQALRDGRPVPVEWFTESFDTLEAAYARFEVLVHQYNTRLKDLQEMKCLYQGGQSSCWVYDSNPTRLRGKYHGKYPWIRDYSTDPFTEVIPKEKWGTPDYDRPLPEYPDV